jgi:hypothetical protein
LSRVGKIAGTTPVDILGGSEKLIFSKAGKFYAVSSGTFSEYDITTPLGGKSWFPATTQVESI